MCHYITHVSLHNSSVTIIITTAAPARHYEIAFMMFDLDGNGEVDVNEFQKVQQVILDSTAVGARHRDHKTTGNVAGMHNRISTSHKT